MIFGFHFGTPRRSFFDFFGWSKFESFVYKNTKLSKDEIEGGLIFYGKGKCSVCHAGTHLSDFKFHNIIFPQLGFGRNGFGVDYGRYNITFDPKDLYKLRQNKSALTKEFQSTIQHLVMMVYRWNTQLVVLSFMLVMV